MDRPDEPVDVAARAGIDPEPERDHGFEAYLADHEERLAEARASAIAAGRRKAGLAGAAMAGAMLAVSDIVEGPKKDDAPVVVEASSDPLDVDTDGVALTVDGVDVAAPPLTRLPPVV
jgi:hypothetical protein